jgi:hypothetical protein
LGPQAHPIMFFNRRVELALSAFRGHTRFIVAGTNGFASFCDAESRICYLTKTISLPTLAHKMAQLICTSHSIRDQSDRERIQGMLCANVLNCWRYMKACVPSFLTGNTYILIVGPGLKDVLECPPMEV